MSVETKTMEEKDACAIIAYVNKRGNSTHANIVKTIDALKKMGHRSGDINGEGDGCGIMIDIPRELWAKRLEEHGLSMHLAWSSAFCVGHILIPVRSKGQADDLKSKAREIMESKGLKLIAEIEGNTRDHELGPRARLESPIFWQVAGLMSNDNKGDTARGLFSLQMEIGTQLPELYVASLSRHSVVYVLRGLPELLPKVFPDLMDEKTRSIICLGHSRYSTNTLSIVERVQPFSILGHNGEINTIEKLRSTGKLLGIPPVPGGSDSQDLNRIIEGLISLYDFDLAEALEMVFPPVHTDTAHYSDDLRRLYDFYRWFFPCSAQGPAAVVARYGDICLGSVDALGLRPLWFGESDYDYFLSSEKGVVDLANTMDDPRPLAPGEKIAIISGRGKRAEVLNYGMLQKRLFKLLDCRKKVFSVTDYLYASLPDSKAYVGHKPGSWWVAGGSYCNAKLEDLSSVRYLAALGWNRYDMDTCVKMAAEGKDVIGSMGHQGPLAALMPEDALPNISEFFKENVAVVTNPAIDREREAEHFSTQVILGDRPDAYGGGYPTPIGLKLGSPLLLSRHGLKDLIGEDDLDMLCKSLDITAMEDVLNFFTGQNLDRARVAVLDSTFIPGQDGLRLRLANLCRDACEAVRAGAVVLVLDDSMNFTNGHVFIDPALTVARIAKVLADQGLRRRCSIIVNSAAIRNLHDIMFLLGLGADALNPYLLWRMACKGSDGRHTATKLLSNLIGVLQKGIEKVMSTMGIHELCGYGRIFASIGLNAELSELFGTPSFCSSEDIGLSYERLEDMARRRYARATAPEEGVLYQDQAKNPKVGRILREVAVGKAGYLEMSEGVGRIFNESPVAIRHVISIKETAPDHRLTMEEVDITIGRHSMPILISAMSFGSQGENSFRAYAEAAKRTNIICLNGEGGEIPDMLGRYRENRGQQIASGRFGVYMGFLNSAAYLEIKIGQGAKPGEGGHLPGAKVSEIVAKARHCNPGIALISPSNHHDIYSIEDLAQIITELKTANPDAQVSVKIPVTSGVGTIAVGIAKAGADVINLSGFEGGTGAAREHAKRYAGLPVEIGVSEANRALVESGLRDHVEIWCDGGIRCGMDVVKMILLGANRVGMGTVALMGVGCISCQRCHLDRCPRGISTQLRTKEDAEAKGVKGFTPRQVDEEAENLSRLLNAIGDEIRMLVAKMGERRLQDLVGRTDLLRQDRFNDVIDVKSLLVKPVYSGPDDKSHGLMRIRRPLNHLTKLISDLAMEQFEKGKKEVDFMDEHVRSTDRAIGTYLAGAIVRRFGDHSDYKAVLHLDSSVPGNGLSAFNIANIDTIVEGGSQDGAAKGSIGGLLAVLKGLNCLGKRIDGSTGKSLAYGAIKGLFIIQNYADSRACVRMSGADAVFGARIVERVRDEEGNIATRSHLKGFAFEYMTGGRVVVLGDPGPWICAGMTGGVVYQCLYPEFGFTVDSLKRRLARGADVILKAIDSKGLADVDELLGHYIMKLKETLQEGEALAVAGLLKEAEERFVMILPKTVKMMAQ
ncbi:MAG: glutamate synthase-related protein [Dissulfurimicrobium hydrothermale]|uniref:glutamate synthase-related protein n=2 Tax=Dissulfurimicrobium TaxID=1769732 RepID=UPI003C771BF0